MARQDMNQRAHAIFERISRGERSPDAESVHGILARLAEELAPRQPDPEQPETSREDVKRTIV